MNQAPSYGNLEQTMFILLPSKEQILLLSIGNSKKRHDVLENGVVNHIRSYIRYVITSRMIDFVHLIMRKKEES